MKKKNFLIILLFLLPFLTSGCNYEPIFSKENINFKITNIELGDDQQLGKRIYSEFKSLLIGEDSAKEINLIINAKKNKKITNKNSAGKATDYKIIFETEIKILDKDSKEILIEKSIAISENYKAQSQLSETLKLEGKVESNLIERTSYEILSIMSQILKSS